MTYLEVLKQCVVDGNNVKLPNIQLDRNLYLEVKKALELIGGKWKGGKVSAFVFPNDPTELLDQIANGEKRNLKKEFQFFATPDKLADELVALAEITDDHEILEPSAGQGAIINAIRRVHSNAMIYYCELMDINLTILQKDIKNCLMKDDFLLLEKTVEFDRIVMNPPFSKNQDIDHVQKAYDHLVENGRLVAVMSKHWQHCQNSKETDFLNWLNSVEATVTDVPEGTFKESGTNIATVIVVIDKK
jgi:predicted RNA methylase